MRIPIRISEELLREDKKMIEDFEARVKEFTESQKMVNSVLDEVRRLLSEIKTAKNNRDIHLIAGQPGAMEAMPVSRNLRIS